MEEIRGIAMNRDGFNTSSDGNPVTLFNKVGVREAGRLLDGEEHLEICGHFI